MASLRVVRRSLPTCLFALLVPALASCSGDSLNPVSGKVLANGKPAVGAIVAFHPEGTATVNTITSTGTVGADGTFTLATGDEKGANPGKYVVTVVWPDPSKQPTEKQRLAGIAVDAPDLLGGRYASRAKSPLRAEIKPGENALEPFEVK